MMWATVTRLRATTATDGHGRAAPNWAAATSTTIEDVKVQPTGSTESGINRAGLETTARLLSKPGTSPDIDAADRIVSGGVTWEVYGHPATFTSPVTGETHHVEAQLRRVVG